MPLLAKGLEYCQTLVESKNWLKVRGSEEWKTDLIEIRNLTKTVIKDSRDWEQYIVKSVQACMGEAVQPEVPLIDVLGPSVLLELKDLLHNLVKIRDCYAKQYCLAGDLEEYNEKQEKRNSKNQLRILGRILFLTWGSKIRVLLNESIGHYGQSKEYTPEYYAPWEDKSSVMDRCEECIRTRRMLISLNSLIVSDEEFERFFQLCRSWHLSIPLVFENLLEKGLEQRQGIQTLLTENTQKIVALVTFAESYQLWYWVTSWQFYIHLNRHVQLSAEAKNTLEKSPTDQYSEYGIQYGMKSEVLRKCLRRFQKRSTLSSDFSSRRSLQVPVIRGLAAVNYLAETLFAINPKLPDPNKKKILDRLWVLVSEIEQTFKNQFQVCEYLLASLCEQSEGVIKRLLLGDNPNGIYGKTLEEYYKSLDSMNEGELGEGEHAEEVKIICRMVVSILKQEDDAVREFGTVVIERNHQDTPRSLEELLAKKAAQAKASLRKTMGLLEQGEEELFPLKEAVINAVQARPEHKKPEPKESTEEPLQEGTEEGGEVQVSAEAAEEAGEEAAAEAGDEGIYLYVRVSIDEREQRRVLVICDDAGVGIDNIEKLLVAGQSGEQGKSKKSGEQHGVGFLSCVGSSNIVEVWTQTRTPSGQLGTGFYTMIAKQQEQGKKGINFSLEQWNGLDSESHPVAVPYHEKIPKKATHGTRVVMDIASNGCLLSYNVIADKVRRLFQKYPFAPIYLNGERINQEEPLVRVSSEEVLICRYPHNHMIANPCQGGLFVNRFRALQPFIGRVRRHEQQNITRTEVTDRKIERADQINVLKACCKFIERGRLDNEYMLKTLKESRIKDLPRSLRQQYQLTKEIDREGEAWEKADKTSKETMVELDFKRKLLARWSQRKPTTELSLEEVQNQIEQTIRVSGRDWCGIPDSTWLSQIQGVQYERLERKELIVNIGWLLLSLEQSTAKDEHREMAEKIWDLCVQCPQLLAEGDADKLNQFISLGNDEPEAWSQLYDSVERGSDNELWELLIFSLLVKDSGQAELPRTGFYWGQEEAEVKERELDRQFTFELERALNQGIESAELIRRERPITQEEIIVSA